MLHRVMVVLMLSLLLHSTLLSAACDRSYCNTCPLSNGSGSSPHHSMPSRTYNPSPPDCAPSCGAECGLSVCAITAALAAVAGLAVLIVRTSKGHAHAHASNP